MNRLTQGRFLRKRWVRGRLSGVAAAALVSLALLFPVFAQETRTETTYTLVLSSGREISGTHYYEEDGQIYLVRKFGAIGFAKESVVDIREETLEVSESSSGQSVDAAVSTETCGQPGPLFSAELRRLPRERDQALARLDQMITRENQRLTELRYQLPAFKTKEQAARRAVENERRNQAAAAQRAARRKAESRERYGISGEDVIASMQAATGMTTIVHAPVSSRVVSEGSARMKREAVERQIEQHLCNISWAEKKRSEVLE